KTRKHAIRLHKDMAVREARDCLRVEESSAHKHVEREEKPHAELRWLALLIDVIELLRYECVFRCWRGQDRHLFRLNTNRVALSRPEFVQSYVRAAAKAFAIPTQSLAMGSALPRDHASTPR